MTTTKLSDAQWAFLAKTQEQEAKGDTHTPPFGSRAAGRAASRWWATASILETRGLLRRDRSAFFLTDEGRKKLSEGKPGPKPPAQTNPKYVIARVKAAFKAQGWPIATTTGRYHPFANTQKHTEGYRVSKVGCSKTVAVSYDTLLTDLRPHAEQRALRIEKMDAARKLLTNLGYKLDHNCWIECDRYDECDG